MLYHSAIVDDPLRFIYGYNETIPVHPSIQTKGEMLAYVQKLFLEYPDLVTHPTYSQLLHFAGSYWQDVGLDRVKLSQMPFERYHEYTNRLRMFLGAIASPPGQQHLVDPPCSHSGGKPDEKGDRKGKKGDHRPFPFLKTISLCSIYGHPTDSWMPSTGVDAEVALVQVQRDALWRWIKKTGVKHVCAHNGESALGLPWDDTVERPATVVPGKDTKGKPSSKAAVSKPPPPTVRLHLNNVMQPPVMIYNAKMSWDMPHFPGRRTPTLSVLKELCAPEDDSGATGVSGSVHIGHAKGSGVFPAAEPTNASESVSTRPAQVGKSLQSTSSTTPASRLKAATDSGARATSTGAPLDGLSRVSAAPSDHTTAAHLNRPWDWLDTESGINKALWMAMHQGHMGVRAAPADAAPPPLSPIPSTPVAAAKTTVNPTATPTPVPAAAPVPAPKSPIIPGHGVEEQLITMMEQMLDQVSSGMPDEMQKSLKAMGKPKMVFASSVCLEHGDKCHMAKHAEGSTKATHPSAGGASPTASPAQSAAAIGKSPSRIVNPPSAIGSAAIGKGVQASTVSSAAKAGDARTSSSAQGAKSPQTPTRPAYPTKPRAIRTSTSIANNKINLDIYISPYHFSYPKTSTAASPIASSSKHPSTSTLSSSSSSAHAATPNAPESKIGIYYEHASAADIAAQPHLSFYRTDLAKHRAVVKRCQRSMERMLGYGNLDKDEEVGSGNGTGTRGGRDRIRWAAGPDAPDCEACGYRAEQPT